MYNCYDEWTSSFRSFTAMPAWTLYCISSLPLRQQLSFNSLLDRLLSSDWAETDNDYSTSGDFEISAVLWTLQIGPSGLDNGFAAGCEVLDILMSAEEVWILENVSDTDYGDKFKALEAYAKGLCQWGSELAALSGRLFEAWEMVGRVEDEKRQLRNELLRQNYYLSSSSLTQ